MKLLKGDTAPHFSLFSSEKARISLSDFQDKNVILLFYPQAFTSTCTKELCSFRDNYKKYESLQAEIIGISVDSVFTLAQYKASQNYNFTLLSDFNREVSRAYGSIYENWIFDMKGVSKRSAFVVDKKGTIRYAEVLEDASDEPNYTAIQEILESL